MKGCTGIEVFGLDGAPLVRAPFGAAGMLALASRGGRRASGAYALLEAPRGDDLVYAVFSRGRRNVHVLAIRGDVCIEGKRACRVHGGETLRIGSLSLGIGVSRPSGRRALRKRFVCAALVGAAAASAAILYPKAPSPSSPDLSSARQASAPAPTEAARDVLASEVADLMQAGLRGQARLAAIEHLERAGESARAREILMALEDTRPTGARVEDGILRADKAARLFEEGMERLRSNDAGGAIERFDRALTAAADLDASPSFMPALVLARSDAVLALKTSLGPKLEALESAVRGAPDLKAGEATRRLAEALRESRDFASVLRDDREWADALAAAERALSASAQRWLTAARAIELYSGCASAAAEYDAIQSALAGLPPAFASQAAEARDRCGERGDRAIGR